MSQGAKGRVLRRLRRQGQWLGRLGTSTQGEIIPEEKTGQRLSSLKKKKDALVNFLFSDRFLFSKNFYIAGTGAGKT